MKKTTNATSGFEKGELVQAALLQIHGEDGAYLCASRKSNRSFIGAFLPDLFSVIYQFSDICRTLQAMDNRSGLPVLICSSQCTFLQSSQF